MKGAGKGRGHGSEDIDTSDSYSLVDPRLVETHYDGTGSDRSLVQTLVMASPPYFQHLTGDRNESDRISELTSRVPQGGY